MKDMSENIVNLCIVNAENVKLLFLVCFELTSHVVRCVLRLFSNHLGVERFNFSLWASQHCLLMIVSFTHVKSDLLVSVFSLAQNLTFEDVHAVRTYEKA